MSRAVSGKVTHLFNISCLLSSFKHVCMFVCIHVWMYEQWLKHTFLLFHVNGIGKNFVFDKREAFDVSNMAGVGGVLKTSSPNTVDTVAPGEDDGIEDKCHDKKKNKRKKNKRKREDDEQHADEKILGVCCVCKVKWDRYIGRWLMH